MTSDSWIEIFVISLRVLSQFIFNSHSINVLAQFIFNSLRFNNFCQFHFDFRNIPRKQLSTPDEPFG